MFKEILRSKEDRSINIIVPTPDRGAIESRFVQRVNDTIILYLSSASGCDRACRFCHLTQTKQTMMTHQTIEGYLDQATTLFDLLVKEDLLKNAVTVHFNFMARGDALLNPHFVGKTQSLIERLGRLAESHSLYPKFKISTIFPITSFFKPETLHLKDWVHTTLSLHPDIAFYYSLYSLNPSFRKRWIPKALDPELVGSVFSKTSDRLVLHHALIEGENSDFETIDDIGAWLLRHEIVCRFNLVRYNPFDASCGQEVDLITLEMYRQTMEQLPNITLSNIVTKRGHDVYASCGMFWNEGK